MPKLIRRTFIAPDGKLRAIWRAIIYYVAARWILAILWDRPYTAIANWLHISSGISAAGDVLLESAVFIAAFLVTGALALYERRRVDSYGLSISRALRRETLEGFILGIIVPGVIALGMILLGGMQIKGLAIHGTALLLSALAWLGAEICVGIAEEFMFRSYLQQTLWKSIGFWPSATMIALIFAGEHYFFKTGENIWDVIQLISFSLLLSYTMLRTGTLWFAVGFHAAFDYMQLFVIGTPNGAEIPAGRLLDVQFNGPAWLTGGVLGTEASFLMFPVMTLVWFFVWWRFRKNAPLQV